ncbi:MAG TPA: hypothetical protein V6C69_00580 [Trichormus sp.]|jgi:hypothetical protein
MTAHFTKPLDVAADDRWLREIETLTAREDWNQLWLLALRTPPIWSVRIIKFLNKRGWAPNPDVQLPLYEELSAFAAKCNEYDLPASGLRQPKTMQLIDTRERIAAGRVTADGEFLFVIDDKASYLIVYQVDDGSEIERIRLDIDAGIQRAVLGFAVSERGDCAVVLVWDARAAQAGMHVYRFDEYGAMSFDKFFKCAALTELGNMVPSMVMSPSDKFLFLLSGKNSITIWDVERGAMVKQFQNIFSGKPSKDEPLEPLPFGVDLDSSSHDWRLFGRRCLSETAASGIYFSFKNQNWNQQCDESSIKLFEVSSVLCARYGRWWIHVFEFPDGKADKKISCSTGRFSLSRNGMYVATINGLHLELADLPHAWKGAVLMQSSPQPWVEARRPHEIHPCLIDIAECADPAAFVACSQDSELVGVAMPHSNCIRLWHAPDGRHLGTLPSLAHEALVDFQFTTGGSLIAVTRSGALQVWESDGNGNAWPWAPELIEITHEPIDESRLQLLRQAETMRKRGWLSVQETNLLDLALILLRSRMSLDIEIDFHTTLPGDIFDIELE